MESPKLLEKLFESLESKTTITAKALIVHIN
jgi:hypothetical protein